MTSTPSRRPPVYAEPGEHQIYSSDGKLISLDAWRERYRPPEVAKQSDIGRAFDIGATFILVCLALWAGISIVRGVL